MKIASIHKFWVSWGDHTGKLVKVDVPQYLIAAKSYALAADSSSSYAPVQFKTQHTSKFSLTQTSILEPNIGL